MARGGKRVGRSGTAYANRTDLNQTPRVGGVPSVAAAVPTGQQYGQAQAQQQMLQQVPIPQQGPAAAPAAPQPAFATPTDVPNLTDPTTRPGEHVMHGAPIGPGAGPEVLPPNALGIGASYSNAHQLLTSLAQTSGSPSLNTILASLQGGM